MATIISLLSQKGGVGKSTLTMMLLNALYHLFGIRVLLIDADFPQYSILKKRQRELQIIDKSPRLSKKYQALYQDREPYSIIQCQLADCPTIIDKHKNEFDLIFVDITGSINQPYIVEFFKSINYFFIPIFQDDLSIYSSMELYSILINHVQPISDAFKGCKIIFNRIPAKNNVQTIREQLSGIEFMEQEVGAYALYERVCRSTVFPMPPNKKETKKFYKFVAHFLQTIQFQKPVSTTNSTMV